MAHATHPAPPALDRAARAMDAFLARYDGLTVAAYTLDMAQWFGWCAGHALDPLTVTRADVELYARWLDVDRHYAPKTRERRISTVCGFYKLAVADGYLQVDPARFVRRPKVPSESPTLGLSYLEFARFLDAAEASAPADHAYAALIGLLGLRCSEAIGARIEHLGEERGHRILRVLGKGGKAAVIPLPVPVFRAIDRAVAGRDAGPLLRTRTGHSWDRSAARRAVHRIARRAGISKRISPHSLRHTFVTQLLDAGAPLRDVQIAARHADPRMTLRYDRARNQLDRHVNYVLAARMAGG